LITDKLIVNRKTGEEQLSGFFDENSSIAKCRIIQLAILTKVIVRYYNGIKITVWLLSALRRKRKRKERFYSGNDIF